MKKNYTAPEIELNKFTLMTDILLSGPESDIPDYNDDTGFGLG